VSVAAGLLDGNSKLVGITAAVGVSSTSIEGTGFAIPAENGDRGGRRPHRDMSETAPTTAYLVTRLAPIGFSANSKRMRLR